jgi:uncharacterized protein YabN with tetrapyrrole methylase and pyrophosphatase domain
MEATPKFTLTDDDPISSTLDWEYYLQQIGWDAPINLERAMMELQEAVDAMSLPEEADEIGDVLQVLIRYCAKKGYCPRQILQKSLAKNIKRTEHCLKNGGIPVDDDHMNELWKKAKYELG